MKRIEKDKLVGDETYLVFAGYEWSPSGFEIAEYDGFRKELTAQSNSEDILGIAEIIFELPDTD